MFLKADKRYPISVEQDTPDVPNDGRFHVRNEGAIVLSTAVLDYAMLTFDELREEHRILRGDPDPRQTLAKESANRDVTRMRGEAIGKTQARKARAGGPGGSGGVG